MTNQKRFCQFCGKDISNLRANATICGSKKCTAAYQQYIKLRPKLPRFCEICGKNIDDLPSQRRICKDPNCISEQKRRKYKELTKEKSCEICGKIFDATPKQKLCPECRSKANNRALEKIKSMSTNAKTIKQEIRCKYCGEFVRYEDKKDLPRTKSVLNTGVCDKCKDLRKKQISKSMKANNKGKRRKGIKRIAFKIINFLSHIIKRLFKNIRKKYISLKIRRRMRINNPVFNKKVVEKIKNTTKKRRELGLIVTKKGSDSPLWRGGANLNRSIRIALRPWVFEKLREKDYICENCGSRGKELHVHHKVPLRDIIKIFLEKSGKTRKELNNINGSQEYLDFVNEIVKFHYDNPEVGIVVCHKCHNKIDKYYRRIKSYHHGKNKENKKNKSGKY